MVAFIVLAGKNFGMVVHADEGPLASLPDEITLYYVQNEYSKKIDIPNEYPTSYHIDMSQLPANTTVSAAVGAFVYANDKGLIAPCQRNVGIAISMGYIEDLDCVHYFERTDRLNTFRYSPCYDIVVVDCGSYHKEIDVYVKNYAEIEAQKRLEKTASEITAGLTSDYEKLEAITKWVADNTDYSVDYSLLHNIVLSEKGDCIANSWYITQMCKSVGIKNARLRRAFQDDNICGSGHVNSYVECKVGEKAGGYEVDVWAGERGRGYILNPDPEGFYVWCEDASTVFQYDGFEKNITIPDKINGNDITTLGKVDRFDENAFAPMFYSKVDMECPVEQVNIPSGITKINKKVLSGAPNLKNIVVAAGNANYKSVDGSLFEKNGKLLYVPPATNSLMITNPDDIQSIDDSAFDDVSDLYIYYGGDKASWNGKGLAIPEKAKDKVTVLFGTTRVTGISVTNPSIQISGRGSKLQIDASVAPANAVNQKIYYKTSDKIIAQVDEDGVIEARGKGICTITAQTADGGFTQDINVEVTNAGRKIIITGGVVANGADKGKKEAYVNVGDTITIVANEEIDNSYFSNWTFPESLTALNNNPNLVYAKSVTLTMPDADVTVVANYSAGQLDFLNNINCENFYCEGSLVQLSVNTAINGGDTTYIRKGIKWSTSDPNIATIDENGILTTLGEGGVTIYATADTARQGNKTVSANITVLEHELIEDTKVIVQMTDCISIPTIVRGTCSHCNQEATVYVPADGEHYWSLTGEVIIKERTCTEPGIARNRCAVCGVCGEYELPPLGHDLDNGVVTKEPTKTEPGERVCTCKRCGEKVPEVIAATGGPEEPQTNPPANPADNPVVQNPITVAIPTSNVYPVDSPIQDNKKTAKYIVTSASDSPTVAYIAPVSKKSKTATVPSTIDVEGQTYKVTEIKANAFSGSKKLTKITIGENVNKIGAKAFYGCTNLKTINIKTSKLTLKSVGKDAFGKVNKKATATVPKKMKKSYTNILRKRGLKGKKQKIK